MLGADQVYFFSQTGWHDSRPVVSQAHPPRWTTAPAAGMPHWCLWPIQDKMLTCQAEVWHAGELSGLLALMGRLQRAAREN